jgi:hypothetical protein
MQGGSTQNCFWLPVWRGGTTITESNILNAPLPLSLSVLVPPTPSSFLLPPLPVILDSGATGTSVNNFSIIY